MNYLNIHTDLLRSETYLGAEPLERATWLNLMGWCASQENGGVIAGASEWTDRKWQQLCGITKEEATLVSELYHIGDNGNMVVNLYPVEKETEVRTKRETAKVNGKKGGRPRKETNNKPKPETQEKPTSVNFPKAEGKGREGKGKERKDTPPTPPEGGVPPDGGGGCVPEARTKPSPEPPPPPEPAALTGDMNQLKARVNALRPHWAKPARWSHAEEHHLFGGSAAQMAELDGEDWDLLRRYLAYRPRQGEQFWQPNSRSKLTETFAGVWQDCQRWADKNNMTTKPRKQPDNPIFR